MGVAGSRPADLAALGAALALGCVHHAIPPGRGAYPPPASPGDSQPAPPVPLPGPEGHLEPDVAGTFHEVRKGETLYRIARAFGIPLRELMEVNDIRDPRQLAAGTRIFIPSATRDLEVPPLTAGAAPNPDEEAATAEVEAEASSRKDAALRWPLKGVLYSRFGVRQGRRHDGIDISAPEGTPVGAAASGTVVYTGEQPGYGFIVLVRHDRPDLLTLYAHNSAILVKSGERVAAGQPIARVGQTGRTTGPHLHFEVREGTRPRNPLMYLP